MDEGITFWMTAISVLANQANRYKLERDKFASEVQQREQSLLRARDEFEEERRGLLERERKLDAGSERVCWSKGWVCVWDFCLRLLVPVRA